MSAYGILFAKTEPLVKSSMQFPFSTFEFYQPDFCVREMKVTPVATSVYIRELSVHILAIQNTTRGAIIFTSISKFNSQV